MKLHHVLGPAALAAIMVVGCTPSAPAPVSSSPAVVSATPTATPSTPTKTPSPLPTLDRHQAAAVAALEGYTDAINEIAAAPRTFTKAAMEARIAQWAGPVVVEANVNSYLDFAERGLHFEGSPSLVWQRVSRAKNHKDERGVEVRITWCRDLRQLRVKRADGAAAAPAEQPAHFLEHEFIVRLPSAGSAWRLYGWDAKDGDCR